MKKLLAGSAVAAALVIGAATTALAADHSLPGTPGTNNCRGQTEAYLAQAAKNGIIDEAYHGIGGVGRWSDMTVAQWQAVVVQYCGQ